MSDLRPKLTSAPASDFEYEVIYDEKITVITAYVGEDSNVVIPSKIKYRPVRVIDEWAFSNYTGLKSVIIPNSVEIIGKGAFSGCRNLMKVIIPKSVCAIDEYAFYGCKRLENIVIPESVTDIGKEAFAGCSNLKFLKIPDSVEVIGESIVKGCRFLDWVYIKKSWNYYEIEEIFGDDPEFKIFRTQQEIDEYLNDDNNFV